MYDSYTTIAGQTFGLLALIFSVLAFATKQDHRLMAMLILANLAAAGQFMVFESYTAAVMTVLVVVRIFLARRYTGSKPVMGLVLAACAIASVLTWQGWHDLPAIIAMAMGTVVMFLLHGISLRVCLGFNALVWMISHILVGSVGGILAEALIFFTNMITVYRLYRAKKRYPEAF